MTSPEDAGRLIEQALIGAGYDLSRDTPERMIAQLRRSFSKENGGARAAAEALGGVSDRTVRRWFHDGLPTKERDRERVRAAISQYYADRRGPRYITPARRAELREARNINVALTQNVPDAPRSRTIGTAAPGSAMNRDVVGELFDAFKRKAKPEQLADILVNGVGSNWYRRALIPTAGLDDDDRAEAYDRHGATVDDAEGFADADDGYASVAWTWQGLTIG